MRFEFICRKCDYHNSWEIHPTRISEFACQNCNTNIAYSDAKIIKFYEKIDVVADKDRYKIIIEPEYIIPDTIDYSGTFTSSTWYPSGTITSSW